MPLYEISEDGSSATIGKIAHIIGENFGSARYSDSITLEQRNSPENLMLLCGTHHDVIDNYDSRYSVEDLRLIKKEFLDKIASSFQEEVLKVNFADLEVTISYLIGNSHTQYEGSLEIITPLEKIKKNELGVGIENLLKMGLVQERQLEEYLNRNLDMTFASRLRNIFVSKYNTLKELNFTSEEIFYELLSFSSNGSQEIKCQAAGLSIVSYYFNVCDIFEK